MEEATKLEVRGRRHHARGQGTPPPRARGHPFTSSGQEADGEHATSRDCRQDLLARSGIPLDLRRPARRRASSAAAATCKQRATAGALDSIQRQEHVRAGEREDERKGEGRRGGRKRKEERELQLQMGDEQRLGRSIRISPLFLLLTTTVPLILHSLLGCFPSSCYLARLFLLHGSGCMI